MDHHPNTERFLAYWRERRGEGAAPHRRDLDPGRLGVLAPQLFMLGREEDEVDVFRLAGALLCDLHGRDLAATPFAALWARPERPAVVQALRRVRRTSAPLVLSAWAAPADGVGVELELTLAPVLGPSGAPDRTFGLYQPLSPLARLQGRTVQGLVLHGATSAAEPRPAHLRLVAISGRRVA